MSFYEPIPQKVYLGRGMNYDIVGWFNEPQGEGLVDPLSVFYRSDVLDARDAKIAALKMRLDDKHEGCTRCVLHDSWMLLPDMKCPACEIAALKAQVESWKREEVLRDEREAGKDAEIAALKADLARSAKANNTLALKIGRLVAAGDVLHALSMNHEADAAWTAAKES